jgi:hypothetical protein
VAATEEDEEPAEDDSSQEEEIAHGSAVTGLKWLCTPDATLITRRVLSDSTNTKGGRAPFIAGAAPRTP